MDAAIGEVVQALKDAQMDDNTVIIFSSDNGGPMNNGASNFPLTGQKGSLYQGGNDNFELKLTITKLSVQCIVETAGCL